MSTKTPEMVVVPKRRSGRLVLIGSVAVLGFAMLALGYLSGRTQAVIGAPDVQKVRAEIERISEKNAQLNAELIDARLGRRVDSQAVDALRSSMKEMQDEIAALNEELTFYKSLMAPSELEKGLKIAELGIVPLDDRTARLELLLTQVATRRSVVQGMVRLDVVGMQGDEQVVLSLTDLAEPATYPLRFRFRYFQDFSLVAELPEGFQPVSVVVTAEKSDRTNLQRSFGWIPQEA